MVGNVCKWLGSVYGNAAVNRSTVDLWAKRVMDGELAKLSYSVFFNSQKRDGDSVLGL
jgi:hypothetical protein